MFSSRQTRKWPAKRQLLVLRLFKAKKEAQTFRKALSKSRSWGQALVEKLQRVRRRPDRARKLLKMLLRRHSSKSVGGLSGDTCSSMASRKGGDRGDRGRGPGKKAVRLSLSNGTEIY